ncbi:hypothetical protein KA005_27515, partial [bacterium]|nr:hypothetical protein [bacterium]
CCPECGNTKRNQLKAIWPKDEPPQLLCTKCGHSDHVGQIQIWFKRIEVEDRTGAEILKDGSLNDY